MTMQDFLVVAGGTLTMLVICLVAGHLMQGGSLDAWEWFVSTYQELMSRPPKQAAQTAHTDRQTDYVSEADLWLDRLELDRTKTALIELLVYSGWEVGQIRGVLKGDNGAIGTEIEAAKIRLGMTEPPRVLRVKDDHGERLIPMNN